VKNLPGQIDSIEDHKSNNHRKTPRGTSFNSSARRLSPVSFIWCWIQTRNAIQCPVPQTDSRLSRNFGETPNTPGLTELVSRSYWRRAPMQQFPNFQTNTMSAR